MIIRKIFILLALLFSANIMSHPVIYKDGFVYWGSFTPDMNTQRFSYTIEPTYSVEMNSTWFLNVDEYRDYTIGINYLIKRWLNFDSQGNIYSSFHTGIYENLENKGSVNHLMLMGDWESRKYYTAGSIMGFYYDGVENYKYNYRLGFAPYIAGMNTLQSWLILKLDYFEESNKNLLITPMVRFFYKNILWEMGSNTQGDSFLTIMAHF